MENKYEYLDLLKKKLDRDQRKVCCSSKNTIVAAGAGSGKTQTLATRFAWLVMSDSSISAPEILTLTFTKKAAAEMYSRIYQTIKFFADNPKTPAKERENARKALDDFSSVHIQTLDSYCGSILKQCANRYGIRPDFSTGSADSTSITKKKALPFVLENRNSPAILKFTKPGELQDFAENVFSSIINDYTSLATKDGYFSNFLEIQKNTLCQVWNYLCGFENHGCKENNILKIKKITEDVSDLTREYSSVIESKAKDSQLPDVEDFEKMWKLIELPKIFVQDFDNNYDQLLKEVSKVHIALQKIEKIALSRKKIHHDLNQIIKRFREKDSPEMAASYIASIHSSISIYKETKELFALLDKFLKQINDEKRSSGALSFKDVSEMSLRALIEQDDLRHQECTAYKKIMIDEFQDNNGANRDLLFLLSIDPAKEKPFEKDSNDPEALSRSLLPMLDRNKLFFVGDEKQSIYKFRGADVAVFNQLQKDLTSINGPDAFLHMSNNYRSAPELLSAFNQIFGGWKAEKGKLVSVPVPEPIPVDKKSKTEEPLEPASSIFAKEVSAEKLFEAGYPLNACATKADSENGGIKPPFEITKENCPAHGVFFIKDNNLTDDIKCNIFLDERNTEAYFIASKIKEIYEKDSNPSYSKFAILEKSRGKREYLTRWLDYFNIPYNLDQQSKIFAEGPVNDIYNFLRLCVYPADVNSYAAFLRSPLCGLSEVSMETILICTNIALGKNTFTPFFDQAESSIKEQLPSVEFEKYIAAKDFFQKEQPKTLSRKLTDTINVLWSDSGYRYETLLNSKVQTFASHFDLIFEIARTTDDSGKSIGWFIDQLSSIKKEEKASFGSEDAEIDVKEIDYPSEKPEGVQILTIHKSKGLEYEHVFIWGIEGKAASDKESFAFFDEKNGVSLKNPDGSKNFFYKLQSENAKAKTLAEFRRLIYVACTRAVKDFYIVGAFSLTEGKKDEECHISGQDQEESLIPNLLMQYYGKFYLTPEGNPFIPENNVTFDFNSASPFDLTILGTKPKYIMWKNENLSEISNPDLFREQIYEKRKAVYESAPVITTPEVLIKEASPSLLEKFPSPERPSSIDVSGTSDRIFNRINEIIERKENMTKDSSDPKERLYKFSYADFGTLAHFVMECFAKGFEPNEDTLISMMTTLPDDKDKYKKELISICRKMRDDFASTEIAKAFRENRNNGKFFQAEWNYKNVIDGWIFNGSLDLIFENDDQTYSIVDYKTDMEIKPELYFYQQSCYRNAASQLLGITQDKIKCYLHFLRFNKTIEITAQANQKITGEMLTDLKKQLEKEKMEKSKA